MHIKSKTLSMHEKVKTIIPQCNFSLNYVKCLAGSLLFIYGMVDGGIEILGLTCVVIAWVSAI